LVTFLCRSKKSDSRNARNAFSSNKELKSNDQSKIKGTPPQSSPALRAREEAKAEAGTSKRKIKMDPSLRWDDD
jgi:hypothetical protein